MLFKSRMPLLSRNVLTHYKVLSLRQILAFHQLINLGSFDVDVESSEWLLEVLKQSTESPIPVQVKQTLEVLDPSQHGGILFFKLIVDRIDHRSFEFIQSDTNYLTSCNLSDTPGEHFPSAIDCFNTVIRDLPWAAIPPSGLGYLFVGASHLFFPFCPCLLLTLIFFGFMCHTRVCCYS